MKIEELHREFELRVNLKNEEQNQKHRKSKDMINETIIINMNTKYTSKC